MREGSTDLLFFNFYSTPRAGAPLLSDGGGPFGFDIQAALQFDFIVKSYGISHILETGCCLGDTTEFLARNYPSLPIWTCDVNRQYADFVGTRLKEFSQVHIAHGDSAELLPAALAQTDVPLVYLDAHWGEQWPLTTELNSITRGVVVVDDFDIDDPRFGFDVYDGVACDLELIRHARPDLRKAFAGNPTARYPYPCLQVGRRAGRCYIPIDLPSDPFEQSEMFTPLKL
ncbi:hypothetical protein ACWDSJ_28210 [Nocardia sp. NPDC003482]